MCRRPSVSTNQTYSIWNNIHHKFNKNHGRAQRSPIHVHSASHLYLYSVGFSWVTICVSHSFSNWKPLMECYRVTFTLKMQLHATRYREWEELVTSWNDDSFEVIIFVFICQNASNENRRYINNVIHWVHNAQLHMHTVVVVSCAYAQ